MKEKKPKKIKIELKEEVAQGKYVNLPIIGFSQAEFILDFIKIIPGIPKADVKSRMIMSPMHTKNLLLLLNEKYLLSAKTIVKKQKLNIIIFFKRFPLYI